MVFSNQGTQQTTHSPTFMIFLHCSQCNLFYVKIVLWELCFKDECMKKYTNKMSKFLFGHWVILVWWHSGSRSWVPFIISDSRSPCEDATECCLGLWILTNILGDSYEIEGPHFETKKKKKDIVVKRWYLESEGPESHWFNTYLQCI